MAGAETMAAELERRLAEAYVHIEMLTSRVVDLEQITLSLRADLTRLQFNWSGKATAFEEYFDEHEQRLDRHAKMHETALQALNEVKQVLVEMKEAVIADHDGRHDS